MPQRKYLVFALEETANLLELLGENTFRIRAYRNAAAGLEKVHEKTETLAEQEFLDISGIGKGISAELMHCVQTGEFAPLQELHEQVPLGVRELLQVRGLGPKKVKQLWESGIDSPDTLMTACENGQLLTLKGFGPKSVEVLHAALVLLGEAKHRLWVHTTYPLAAELCHRLSHLQARTSGEILHGAETVSEVLLTVTASAEETHQALTEAFPEIEWTLDTEDQYHIRTKARLQEQARIQQARTQEMVQQSSNGHEHSDEHEQSLQSVPSYVPSVLGTATITEGTQVQTQVQTVSVRVAYASAHDRSALDLWLGSPPAYQDILQSAAEDKRQYFAQGRLLGHLLETEDTQTLEQRLGLKPRSPLHRDPEHLKFDPPHSENLVKVTDIKGLLHTHSLASDGRNTWPEMLEEALRLGHEYLGTGDHSVAAHYAGGLSEERLRQQMTEVRAMQADGLPIVFGAEVDILLDGRLDYPDDLLEQLDYVVASVHIQGSLGEAEQTKRIIKAVSHPLVSVLGHMTGRVLLRREGYALDIDAVVEACKTHRTAVELNANPQRLDLSWRHLLRWHADPELLFAINTDAHDVASLSKLHYGVVMARKAMLPKRQIINTWSREEFLAWARPNSKSS